MKNGKRNIWMLNVDINVVQQLTWKWCSWSGLVNESKNGATEVDKCNVNENRTKYWTKYEEIKKGETIEWGSVIIYFMDYRTLNDDRSSLSPTVACLSFRQLHVNPAPNIFVLSQLKWPKFDLQPHFLKMFLHTKFQQLSITCAFRVTKLLVEVLSDVKWFPLKVSQLWTCKG